MAEKGNGSKFQNGIEYIFPLLPCNKRLGPWRRRGGGTRPPSPIQADPRCACPEKSKMLFFFEIEKNSCLVSLVPPITAKMNRRVPWALHLVGFMAELRIHSTYLLQVYRLWFPRQAGLLLHCTLLLRRRRRGE